MKNRVVKIVVAVPLVIILIVAIAVIPMAIRGKKIYEVMTKYITGMNKITSGELTNYYYKQTDNEGVSELYSYNGVEKLVIDYDDFTYMHFSVKDEEAKTNTVTSYYTMKDGSKKVMCEEVYNDVDDIEGVTQIDEEDIKSNSSLITWIITGFNQKIKTDTFNDRECYVIYDGYSEVYFDKETGLILKSISKTGEDEEYVGYEYKFDVVTKEDVTQPDDSEYTMINPDEFKEMWP